MVSLGIDLEGRKQILGFWQGATENHEVCKELLADMERRGLSISRKVIWITDGGRGIIKELRDRFGKKLRKTLHSTNPIKSMFSTVRDCEGNIKRYRGSRMSQRWLALVLPMSRSQLDLFEKTFGH